jgi:hypothetical protein
VLACFHLHVTGQGEGRRRILRRHHT